MRHIDIILTDVDDGLEFPECYRGRLEALKILSYVSLPVPGVIFLPGASGVLVSVDFVDFSKELWWLIQGQDKDTRCWRMRAEFKVLPRFMLVEVATVFVWMIK